MLFPAMLAGLAVSVAAHLILHSCRRRMAPRPDLRTAPISLARYDSSMMEGCEGRILLNSPGEVMACDNRIGSAALCVVVAMYLAACGAVSGSPSTASVASPVALKAPGLAHGSRNPSLPILPVDLLGQSRVITDYLKAHNLPLVGASMAADQPTQSGRQ
jgi:hypothetical protein